LSYCVGLGAGKDAKSEGNWRQQKERRKKRRKAERPEFVDCCCLLADFFIRNLALCLVSVVGRRDCMEVVRKKAAW
jgi:hypothetical protein